MRGLVVLSVVVGLMAAPAWAAYIADDFEDNDLVGWAVYDGDNPVSVHDGYVDLGPGGNPGISNLTTLPTLAALVYETDVQFASVDGNGTQFELMFALSDATLRAHQGNTSHYALALSYAWGSYTASIHKRDGWSQSELDSQAGVAAVLNDWLHFEATYDFAGNMSAVVTDSSDVVLASLSAFDASPLTGAYMGVRHENLGAVNVDNVLVTPEPVTLGLLAVGGLALLRRRR